jgi:hypothetical protein
VTDAELTDWLGRQLLADNPDLHAPMNTRDQWLIWADSYYREWAPMTDMRDAWQIVEAMRARGWVIARLSADPTDKSGLWEMDFEHAGECGTRGLAYDDTPARAISEAAYAALQAEAKG